jgi:hypothetical protein
MTDTTDLEGLLHEIVQHHRNEPDHGINCACMDEFIRQFRRMTEAPVDRGEQRRVDYVILAAVNGRR